MPLADTIHFESNQQVDTCAIVQLEKEQLLAENMQRLWVLSTEGG